MLAQLNTGSRLLTYLDMAAGEQLEENEDENEKKTTRKREEKNKRKSLNLPDARGSAVYQKV
jgi:hypothetical protein